MIVIDFIQSVLVTILIGYMGVTDTLATKIDSWTHRDEAMFAAEDEKTFAQYFSEAISTFEHTVPRVLLDNPEFQRAAAIASSQAGENSASPVSAESIEDALVNIFCQYQTETHIRTTTGTGFFINSKGVILTNAHVAQFLLLEGTEDVIDEAKCVVRTGNPATPKYEAKLLYISPAWILANASLIDDEMPRGTGERDYALLYVSASLDDEPLPASFPSIRVDTELLSRSVSGRTVIGAGYPAAKLILEGSKTELAPVIVEATIGTLYTFGSNYADIFSISDSLLGEQGASGGPVVEKGQGAIGLIVTKGDTEKEGEHSLRALTLSYVDRTIVEETGFTLAQNMQGDAAARGKIFQEAIAPFLTELLTKELQ